MLLCFLVAFNGLDNALITFNNVRVERTRYTHLNDFQKSQISHLYALFPSCFLHCSFSLFSSLLAATLDKDGNYTSTIAGPGGFIQMAQRLLSGRIALAGGALCITRQLCTETETYADSRLIPGTLLYPFSSTVVFYSTLIKLCSLFVVCFYDRFLCFVKFLF